jgi:hypothetical protein
MIKAQENAKILESARDEITASALVHFPAAILRAFRRSHNSPTRTSRARVAANKVRSIVRPANLVNLRTTLLEASGTEGVMLVYAALSFDCSNFMLSHAAINDENHLESLI